MIFFLWYNSAVKQVCNMNCSVVDMSNCPYPSGYGQIAFLAHCKSTSYVFFMFTLLAFSPYATLIIFVCLHYTYTLPDFLSSFPVLMQSFRHVRLVARLQCRLYRRAVQCGIFLFADTQPSVAGIQHRQVLDLHFLSL